jgi:fatty-acyl-CoA synthase
VIDAYGSTEGGISVVRTPETPPAALGLPVGDVRVLYPATGKECAVAELDAAGRLLNPGEAVGELVNVGGSGAFEGYWANPEAEDERVRDGRYHSGDLAYRDADGFLYFAGRLGDWLRVGGENFGAAPVQRVLARHSDVVEVVVLGVPDAVAGDQVLAVVVPVDGVGAFDVAAFGAWLDAEPDLSPRWRPRYVRVVDAVPTTGTGKVRRRELQTAAWHAPHLWVRGGAGYRPFTTDDAAALSAAFDVAGRGHLYPQPDPEVVR